MFISPEADGLEKSPVPAELKGSTTEGIAPQVIGDLFEGLLGAKVTAIAAVSDVGHTDSTLEFGVGGVATAGYEVGMSIVVKEASAYYHCAIESISGDFYALVKNDRNKISIIGVGTKDQVNNKKKE